MKFPPSFYFIGHAVRRFLGNIIWNTTIRCGALRVVFLVTCTGHVQIWTTSCSSTLLTGAAVSDGRTENILSGTKRVAVSGSRFFLCF